MQNLPPRAYLTVRPLPLGTLVAQSDGIAWMKAALRRVAAERPMPDLDRALRLYDLLARQSQIESRVTCLADYTHQDWDAMRVHTTVLAEDAQADGAPEVRSRWDQAPLGARMEVFAETARDVAEAAFAADTEAPDALIQVSCTGYDSPSAVQHVIAARGWHDRTRVLSLGHMGCYAALPAAALAADLVSATAARSAAHAGAEGEDADARATVLLVELCTLHHDPSTTDVEQIVQQCLFADGAARLDITAQPAPGAFALLDHMEAILPDTLGEMTWRPGNPAFRMTLSRAVPAHIRTHVGGALTRLLGQNGLAVDDVDVFAVHPGGPRIIESTADALGLDDAQVRHSHAVLRARGNMSSTTLPHIWARIAADDGVTPGALVCSVAFGPGLTVTANLMRKGPAA
jgi:predicted naringenin-chalcone synthase